MRLLTIIAFLVNSYSAFAGCIQADQVSNEIQKIKNIRTKSNLTTEAFVEKSYPSVKFVDAALPRFWMGPLFTELVGEPQKDGKSFYQSLCTNMKNNQCKQWCIVRADSPQFYQEKAKQAALDLCAKCEKDNVCDNVQLLKNSSDMATMNTFEKVPVIIQMANDGRLLVFQTSDDGKKDLKKPYIELTQTVKDGTTSQKITVVGSPQGAASVQTTFTPSSDFGYYGFRACDLMMMSVDNCSPQVAPIAGTGLNYSCLPKTATPTNKTGGASKVKPEGVAN